MRQVQVDIGRARIYREEQAVSRRRAAEPLPDASRDAGSGSSAVPRRGRTRRAQSASPPSTHAVVAVSLGGAGRLGIEKWYRFSARGGARPTPPPAYRVIVAAPDVGVTPLRDICSVVAARTRYSAPPRGGEDEEKGDVPATRKSPSPSRTRPSPATPGRRGGWPGAGGARALPRRARSGCAR